MPDHVHAVLSFQRDKSMSEVIRDWKRFHTRTHRVMWQEGYFDHRLRPDERGTQLSAKLNYIRQNPVVVGLCARAEDWPWVIDPFASEGGSACPPRRWVLIRRRRRYPAAKPHVLANALRTMRSTSALLAARLYGGDFSEIWWEIVRGERLDIHFD